MKKNLKNKKWYSVLVVIIIIWFLTVLTTWVLKLILAEMKDNMTIWSYLKAYAWAESAQELALFEIKKNWYESDKEMKDKKNISDIWTTVSTKNNKDVYISYKKDLKTDKLENFVLEAWETLIIPLFYMDSSINPYEENAIENLDIKKISWEEDKISWNIISEKFWISWDGLDFKNWFVKIHDNLDWLKDSTEFNLTKNDKEKVDFYLAWSIIGISLPKKNYLQLLNWWDKKFTFDMSSNNKFSHPKVKIISSWESGNYKTNLETEVDFSLMNSFSKYSIFAP